MEKICEIVKFFRKSTEWIEEKAKNAVAAF